jgi:hypothetical protein
VKDLDDTDLRRTDQYTYNGVVVEADWNGWLYTPFWFWGRCLQIEVNIRRPELVVSFGGRGKMRWSEAEAVTMGVGVVGFGQPPQPLLDWCLEHADAGWKRETLEDAIETLNRVLAEGD